ncbi:hypothetical protein T4A_13616 [Trichinella pseudospiralis]|uniref:Uncharacterized protein n=1 Tax=Trichinella pseudospiralis TaxID=6337 RepID=A0A0V1EWD9_TRIPS|nr:hypothetical protein T4A_13616 [Trichinella pseudospiralis]KRZ41472.1 hypothetical protein T4C_2790 [Trichinella pseudospiralis]
MIINKHHNQPQLDRPVTASDHCHVFRLPTVLLHRSSSPNVPPTVAEYNSVVDHDQLRLSSSSFVDSGILQRSSASYVLLHVVVSIYL